MAKNLLEDRLIACANIIPQIESLYHWEGKIEEERESILIAKTREDKVESVIKRVEEIHSYETPCILQIEVKKCSRGYLDWMDEELNK